MTSKNSFWASIKENNKRRIWVWALSALAFILIFPAYTALRIRNVLTWAETYIKEDEELLRSRLYEAMSNTLGFSYLIVVLATILAVVAAVQGFSYLYSKKKIDFYQGMPVKRKKRFLVIWFNGILIFVLPYLLGLLLSLAMAAANGGINGSVMQEIGVAFGVHICFYLCVYHLAILAVMMTGNVVLTGLGFTVFCLYELLARVAIQTYMALFFKYYTSAGSIGEDPLLSPFRMYLTIAEYYLEGKGLHLPYTAGLILFTVVLGFAGYFCYKKRPAEAAGRAMAFKVTQPFIKIALSVQATLLAGLVIAETAGFQPQRSMDGMGYVIFAMVATLLISSGLIQVVYEADIRGALHKKNHIVIGGILVALFFMVFRYDFAGYDSYVPEPEEVESVAFIPANFEWAGANNFYMDPMGNGQSQVDYIVENMFIPNVDSMCELARDSMEEYNRVDLSRDDIYYTDALGNQFWSNATVLYRLKNGREVYRSLWVNVEDAATIDYLNEIIGSEEFKTGYFLGGIEGTLEHVLEENQAYTVEAQYGNTVYNENMRVADVQELLTAYRQDMEKMNFSTYKDQVPAGRITLRIINKETTAHATYAAVTRNLGMNIYPSFENSISYLMEKGYFMDFQLKMEDVEKIQIINHNFAIKEEQVQLQGTRAGVATIEQEKAGYDEYEDTRVYADYTQPAEIEELAQYLYPSEMLLSDWKHGQEMDEDYEVAVYFKTDSEMTKTHGTIAYYGFVKDQVPEFVQEDTLYRR